MFDLKKLSITQDEYYKKVIAKISTDKKNIWYGGIRPDLYNINTFNSASTISAVYFNKESKYYNDKKAYSYLIMNLNALLNMQMEDGLISLFDCNIQSPPDTSFAINAISIIYYCAKKSQVYGKEIIMQKIVKFLENVKDTMLETGGHTPNHRWVISCANAFLYDILGDKRQKEAAMGFLREGFDITPDGEWTERSNCNYNPHCDLSLYHVAEIFDYPEAYHPGRKNLEMMKFLIHPNKSVATEYSTRQDRKTIKPMDAYYATAYKLFAVLDDNEEFEYLADSSAENLSDPTALINYIIAFEDIMLKPINSKPISDKYVKIINAERIAENKVQSKQGDPLLRYRDGLLSITLITGQPDAFFIQYGNARIPSIKLPLGFFGKPFCYNTIEMISENKFLLKGKISHSYFGKLPDGMKQENYGEFNGKQHDLRPIIKPQEVIGETIVTIKGTQIEIEHKIQNIKNLFAQINFGFDIQAKLSGNLEKKESCVEVYDPSCHIKPYHKMFQCTGGIFTVEQNEYKFEINTGEGPAHQYLALRGNPIYIDYQNVNCNMITPFNKKITINCKKIHKGEI